MAREVRRRAFRGSSSDRWGTRWRQRMAGLATVNVGARASAFNAAGVAASVARRRERERREELSGAGERDESKLRAPDYYDAIDDVLAATHAPFFAPASAMTGGAWMPSTISASATARAVGSTSAPASTKRQAL